MGNTVENNVLLDIELWCYSDDEFHEFAATKVSETGLLITASYSFLQMWHAFADLLVYVTIKS